MQANPTMVRVTKLDAAKRQLETAILLYFQFGDEVSIHTLCCAAYDVIQVLNSKRNDPLDPNKMMMKDFALYLDSKADRKRFHDSLNAAQNFFKHGNSDADSVLTLNTKLTEDLLIDAVQKFVWLVGECPETMALYFLWHVTEYPNKIDAAKMPDSLRKDIERSRSAMTKDRARFYVESLPAAKAIAKAFSAL